MNHSQKALVIVGPTASGKSALAVELARALNGEIISADSRQVYRGLDIGTGKITKKQMCGIPHHALDIASPRKNFSAGAYVKHAAAVMADIHKRGKLPIICGGTGFYIDALFGRIALPDVPPNRRLRSKLKDRTPSRLYALLAKKDPVRARAMSSASERNNAPRLIRALEIAEALGSVPSPRAPGAGADTAVLWLGLKLPQAEIERKIRARLNARMKQGMLAEARRLHARGLSYKRMEELGLEYRAMARHLSGRITREQMLDELARDIRRYAKKQLAYWKRNRAIEWFHPKNAAAITRRARQWAAE